MKRLLLLTGLLLGLTTVVSAQAKDKKKPLKAVVVTSKNKKPAGSEKTIKLNNRKIYRWTNGQRSTPTGQDATSSNGSGYAAIKKDTAKVIRKKDQ